MALSDYDMTESDAEYILSSLLHSHILEILAFGMYTVVYCLAVYFTGKLSSSSWSFVNNQFYKVSRGAGRVRVRSAFLITIIWMLCTVRTIVKWVRLDTVFSRHADSRETQLAVSLNSESYYLDLTRSIVSFLTVFLADTIMVSHTIHNAQLGV